MRAPARLLPVASVLVALMAPLLVAGQCNNPPAPPPPAGRQPCASYDPLRQPLFGETHSHSTFSFDAALVDVRTDPSDAYDFAKGAPIDLPPYDANGVATRTTQLRRPLDWAFVTDHAEYFGEAAICIDPAKQGYNSTQCTQYRDAIGSIPGMGLPPGFVVFALPLLNPTPTRFPFCGVGGNNCLSEADSIWLEIQAAAEQHYDRTAACNFTTFVAYEWTANTNASNLHRNVVFRNEIVPARPTSYFEANTPEDLHDALQTECLDDLPGCDVLAIPHNSNLSQGNMFNFSGNTAEQNAKRAFFEPLVEMYQHKGSSECRFGVGNNDELCDFESMDRTQVAGLPDPNQPFPPLGFVRNGLLEGLAEEDRTGVNPVPVGFVGGADTHNNIPGGSEEDIYPGHLGTAEATPEFRLRPDFQAPGGLDAGPGGLTVAWAEENSRESLFEAMLRRETYATSGTRPIVRFFGGWKYPADLCAQNDFVLKADELGVPMGSDLPPRLAADWTPKFALLALQDVGTQSAPGTPLQAVQVIKGWVDANGQTQEETLDVAGDRNNGADVDLATCQPTGAGFSQLCTVWQDPNFDPDLDAFYYARVVENPTCRWSQHLCVQNAITCTGAVPSQPGFEPCCDGSAPQTIQERAWTSPIYYHSGN